MLHQFLTDNESDLIDRCRSKAAVRPLPLDTKDALHNGIPVFLRQLIRILTMEQTDGRIAERRIPSAAQGGRRSPSEMSKTATIHGRELLDHGFTIDQVVHAYGDVCQSITDLALERGEP